MNFATGQTIYDTILSLDANNNPVSSTTFDISTFRNGTIYTGITINTTLIEPSKGIFSSSWSADTTGTYQIIYKNNVTNVFYVSNSYLIKTDEELSTNIYVGI